MKIFEFCPYFKERKIAELKIKEASYWIDELNFCEAGKTFSYNDKPLNFDTALVSSRVKYHRLNAEECFDPVQPDVSYYNPDTCGTQFFDEWYWHLLSHNYGYFNEAVQRNHCTLLNDIVNDDDIVILSDVDEFLDSRLADRIIDTVKRHQVITVRLHFSVFYLDLFCDKSHGPDDFSYRTYVMTGRYFRKMPFTSDYLRKKGVSGGLARTVHCPEGFMGFHHSWLQHQSHAFEKQKAVQSNIQDKGLIRSDFAEQCIRDMRLPHLDANLYIANDKPFLRSVLESDTQGFWLGHAP
ncbi:hypothetical protein [Mycobacterium montefiorense]|uniref:Uncharacterized protein n=1 Tax=Mycobacterium montefiorense TaxID=154654 RepID=A0AA37V401_9MYCO|nr:hypothetical protein [Mycobacterium montefiorense]GBG40150.1 hypothetical protein MmonteBS_45220 [Mycobacterium montefiorense]GKU36527.1 hypothetical protein NJB14191_38730 [Mycobacterium montefiorense]GKU38002.1 hypothetical protein NJB14192_00010 [Mycobacterium montefiorense]GKU45265.1 hypothetical protein NJB14194_18880 [Mycobacterium montefiorense]GKU50484.1 hypothetical protein NJB14195_17300 [Mycobacterium montefiorense]